TVSIGEDKTMNFLYTYIMVIVLYMVIMLYGQLVASGVAAEKSNRAMELLITSANPISMMFGKVLACGLAGLGQIAAIFGSAVLFYGVNKSYWAGSELIESLFAIPGSLLVYMLVFFVLGFFIYAFLYGAVGSTVSKTEDVGTASMPINMAFIVVYMVVIFSLSSGSVDNAAMKILSFFPLTSPMAMFARIAMSTVPFWEIALSIGLLVAGVVVIGVLAAKIYRVGVLLYGTRPKLGELIKALKRA
ncbi:MAG: ABC transporter permease, partial [Oscillospiraceae bacterium]|nr:ABC transporter permease [Oscillospiraceae bacterium]